MFSLLCSRHRYEAVNVCFWYIKELSGFACTLMMFLLLFVEAFFQLLLGRCDAGCSKLFLLAFSECCGGLCVVVLCVFPACVEL